MQVIFLLPFLLLMAVFSLLCLAVPRWRRYAFAALVSPLAFAFCSIVGILLIVALQAMPGVASFLGLGRALGDSWRGTITFVVLFFGSGVAGAVVAAIVATHVQDAVARASSPGQFLRNLWTEIKKPMR